MSQKRRKKVPPASSRRLTIGVLVALAMAVIAVQYLKSYRRAVPPESRPNALAQERGASSTPGPVRPMPVPDVREPDAPLSESEQALRLLNQGTQSYSDGKVEEAIQLFQAALKKNPDDEDGHYNLAIAYARVGRTNEAIMEYEAALKIVPDYVEVHNNLGNLLVRMKKYEEAEQHFREAMKADPENSSTHNNLGTVLARQKKTADAEKEFQEAVRLNPKYAEAHFNLGNCCLEMGRADDAIQHFTEALKLNPDLDVAKRGLELAHRQKELNLKGK